MDQTSSLTTNTVYISIIVILLLQLTRFVKMIYLSLSVNLQYKYHLNKPNFEDYF